MIGEAGGHCGCCDSGRWRGDRPGLAALNVEGSRRCSVHRSDVAGQHKVGRAAVAGGDFHFAFDNLNRGALVCHGNAERRALDDSREKRRFNGKVRHRHFLDLVDDVAEILDDLRQSAGFGRLCNADPRIGSDDKIFLATNQNRTAIASGVDDIARRHGAAARRSLDEAGRHHRNLTRCFGQRPPRRTGISSAADQQTKRKNCFLSEPHCYFPRVVNLFTPARQ